MGWDDVVTCNHTCTLDSTLSAFDVSYGKRWLVTVPSLLRLFFFLLKFPVFSFKMSRFCHNLIWSAYSLIYTVAIFPSFYRVNGAVIKGERPSTRNLLIYYLVGFTSIYTLMLKH